jgi:hypothetical protein
MPALALPGARGGTAAVRQPQQARGLARKRPRLIPVYDRIVKKVAGGDPNYWVPLCEALQADDRALHHRLLRLHQEAGLPPAFSALRVFDVIAWMEGKKKGY